MNLFINGQFKAFIADFMIQSISYQLYYIYCWDVYVHWQCIISALIRKKPSLINEFRKQWPFYRRDSLSISLLWSLDHLLGISKHFLTQNPPKIYRNRPKQSLIRSKMGIGNFAKLHIMSFSLFFGQSRGYIQLLYQV